MDFSSEIAKFISEKEGGIVIMEKTSGKVVYSDGSVQNTAFSDNCPGLSNDTPCDWEYFDSAERRFYKIYSALFTKDGIQYVLHHLLDISEYIELNRDVTKYMSFFRKLSAFQNAVISNLGNTYYEMLPLLTDFFKTDMAYLILEQDGAADIISYDGGQMLFNTDRAPLESASLPDFDGDRAENIRIPDLPANVGNVFSSYDGAGAVYIELINGHLQGMRYLLLLRKRSDMDFESVTRDMIVNVVKTYIENGIMHEKLVYESEHDKLTGLYNKGKYIAMEDSYRHLDSIAIFNFDVNNLKYMNDNFGHEAGDALIVKAANSIRNVVSANVHGYRMGGDEYMMVACNATRAGADMLLRRWEESLGVLNEADDGINCIIAVGFSYGEGNYDYDALMREADERMYEDKKSKKKPGEEIR